MGKLLVNQLQVVKRNNTPLIPQQMASSAGPWVFGSWVRSPPSTIINFSDFPHVELEKNSPWCPQERKRLILTGPPYIRPTCYPAVSGGKSVIRLGLGKLLASQLQVVKRTNTSLIPQHYHFRPMGNPWATTTISHNGRSTWMGYQCTRRARESLRAIEENCSATLCSPCDQGE